MGRKNGSIGLGEFSAAPRGLCTPRAGQKHRMLTGSGVRYWPAGKSKRKFPVAAWAGGLFLEANRVQRDLSCPRLLQGGIAPKGAVDNGVVSGLGDPERLQSHPTSAGVLPISTLRQNCGMG